MHNCIRPAYWVSKCVPTYYHHFTCHVWIPSPPFPPPTAYTFYLDLFTCSTITFYNIRLYTSHYPHEQQITMKKQKKVVRYLIVTQLAQSFTLPSQPPPSLLIKNRTLKNWLWFSAPESVMMMLLLQFDCCYFLPHLPQIQQSTLFPRMLAFTNWPLFKKKKNKRNRILTCKKKPILFGWDI